MEPSKEGLPQGPDRCRGRGWGMAAGSPSDIRAHSGMQGLLGSPILLVGIPLVCRGCWGPPIPLDPSGLSGCCEVFRTEVWITPATHSDHQGLPQPE